MTDETHAREQKEIERVMATIKRKILVVSAKGGVGKSTVAALLAVSMQKKGASVGILDADITGSSMPRLFGITSSLNEIKGAIIPVRSKRGIPIVSSGFLLENETQAIFWRGPLLGGMLRKFLSSTNWGGIDTLIIDCPPGTSDIPITLNQSILPSGAFLVTTPQELSRIITSRSIGLLGSSGTPVYGIIENMVSIRCTHCGKEVALMQKKKDMLLSGKANSRVVSRLPIDPQLAEKCDEGRIEDYACEEMDSLVERMFFNGGKK